MTFESLIGQLEEISRELPTKKSISSFIGEMWSRCAPQQVGEGDADGTWEAVVLSAASSDRPWLGGAGAIQGAINHLLASVTPNRQREPGEIVAFCGSEIGGNHPRAIETTITANTTGGGYSMTGTKRWATLGPMASHLLVIVSEGDDGERNHLRAVLVPADRAGVFVEEMTIPGSVQANLRLPHSLVNLENVEIFDAEVLPGDGYSLYLKPFRTVEDLFSCSARAAALLSLGFRHAASVEEVEGLIALLSGLRTLLGEDLSAPSSHLVIGAAENSLPELGRSIVGRLPPETASWWMSDGEVQVASAARGKRRELALEKLLASAG